MRLSSRSLDDIAVMICGDADGIGSHFPYRSSSALTRFIQTAGLPYAHDGTTRRIWVKQVLEQVNLGPSSSPDLPSDGIVRVLVELMDPVDFEGNEIDRDVSLAHLNKVLARHSLLAYLDSAGRCHIRNDGTGTSSSLMPHQPRPLSKEELAQRERVAAFLASASEDEFTEKVLVPLFQRLGFHRVTASGHREKMLEFGKDLWMKFQLPTGHWLYFCAQVKRGKIDARARFTSVYTPRVPGPSDSPAKTGRSDCESCISGVHPTETRSKGVTGGTNVAEILSQAKMAMGNAIFDPDANRKVLLDHLFVISAGEITRQARAWLVEKLDQEQRRHVIFMDRDDFLNHAARILVDLDVPPPNTLLKNDFPPF